MTEGAEADFRRGLDAFKKGDRSGALSGFLMALALEPGNALYRQHALTILGTSGGYTSLPKPVLDALALCGDDQNLDVQPLALVVQLLLPHHPSVDDWLLLTSQDDTNLFDQSVADGVFDELAADPLIRPVLRRTTSVSPVLEDIVTGIRRHTLKRIAIDKPAAFLNRHKGFFAALCDQAERSDYAWVETEEETSLISSLGDSELQRTIRRAYRHAEQLEIGSFPNLTSISDAVSKRVQSQYTSYPYPRWEAVPAVTQQSLHDFIASRFPSEEWPNRFKGSVTGLSAGCGTGRGMAMLARSIKDMDLTAIDLSPASLTFAAEKVRALGLSSIKFGVGDILEIKSLGTLFDVIECSGVLHHMNDPLAGLIALRDSLKSDGIMRVALYSERARSAVVAAREWVETQGFDDSHDGLRKARAALRALPNDHPARGVVEPIDFNNLSGLHDLIFNVQEHRFTPRGLKSLLAQADLRFLGFDHSNPDVPKRFLADFGPHDEQTDLDNWEVFEQNHPDTFSAMYQMWCRPTS